MDNKINNVLMVGVGGQGTVLSSNILSLAAMYDGHDVKKSEIHGMSQRGGSVFSHVRFGTKVHSAVIPAGEAEVLMSLEEMETLRWLEYLSPTGRILCLKENILPTTITEYPQGGAEFISANYPGSYVIDPAELKVTLQNVRVFNVAMLGLLSRLIGISTASWERAITELSPDGTAELNLKAFNTGRELFKA